MLSNITLWRVVSRTIMRIIRGMRISEGQIIQVILYKMLRISKMSAKFRWENIPLLIQLSIVHVVTTLYDAHEPT